MRFLPTLAKENVPSLLLEAIVKGYESATLKLLKSQPMDALTKGKLFQLAAEAKELDTIQVPKKLLQSRVNDCTCISDQKVLQWAAEAGHIGMVILLLRDEPI